MAAKLSELMSCPIIQAPMAGGASGPALAAAVAETGALGFLAAGYKTAAALNAEIGQTRRLTSAPFGVNLFVPARQAVDETAVIAYRDRLIPEAERLGVCPGDPVSADDDWDGKLELLLADPVPVVSFTFGRPSRDVYEALRRRGSLVVVTVTAPYEAMAAADVADALCVQGAEAGGHRASFANEPSRDTDTPLRALLASVREVTGLPLIAAGGLADGAGIRAALAAGAVAVQLGTALLRTDESGAHPLHKAALAEPYAEATAVTRAFSGRPARGLVNRFVTRHSAHAPAAYPHVHHLTAPLRRAAAARGEPDGMALWAGQGFRSAESGPVAEILARLANGAGLNLRGH